MEILRKKEFEEDRLFQNFHEMILYHMRQMQQCLTTAGKMFCDHNDEEETCEKRGRDVVESVILKECVGCRENQKCQFTLADKDRLGQIIEKQGGLSYADLKRCHPCKNGQDFIEEANKIYERELFLRAMRNQMKQLRKIVGEQYIRAGNTLGDFFQGKVSLTTDNKKLYEKITKGFAKSQLRLKEIYFYDNPEKGKYQAGIIDIIDLDNLPVDLPFAKVDGRAGKAAYEYIESAVKYTMKNEIHAIVTAPLNKEALNLGGVHYPGHTEILGHLTGQKDFSMMLTSPKLRVIHVSTHIALHDVPKVVKKERISKVIDLAQETLKLMGFDEPRIAVAGLNPHCGEGGLFGDEDEKEIVPAIKEAQAKGYNVTGPVPPDSVFHRAANLDEFDIVVVMYHDQGHIPIKVLGFDSGVNVTVGLPCIRTSVDHGTAFPVAGTGKASENSMLEALKLGAQMAKVKFYDLLNE